MIRLYHIAALLVLLFTATVAQAQPATHATLSATLNRTGVMPGQEAVIAIVVDVAPGYHAQSNTPTEKNYIPFLITPGESEHATFGAVQYPVGQEKTYPMLGRLNVYDGRVVAYVPVTIAADAPPGELKLTGRVRYQICDDTTCFLPQTRPFEVVTIITTDPSQAQVQDEALFAGYVPSTGDVPPAQAMTADTGTVTPVSIGGDWTVGAALAAALLAGLLFNVMPCVLPVVPLKAIGFYEVSQHNRTRSLLYGLTFSAGLVASFAVLGLFVVVLKTLNWGELFTIAWFRLMIIGILLAMAIGTFGLFTVNLPASVYRFSPRHDTYLGNFLFGILTALLSTPCTFGLFVGLLAWAATQPATIGVGVVITVGIGMASPYFILSAFPELARRFPRTGPWAELVKQLMAFLLLATAVFFAKPFIEVMISSDAFWWLLFGVVSVAALFLVARTIGFTQSRLGRAVAVMIALLMVGPAFVGARMLTYHPYDWQPYTPEALAEARATGKLVFVEFTADWCGNCHWLEATVINDRSIVSLLNDHGTIMLKADVTAEDAPGLALLGQLSAVGGIPLTALYPPGQEQPLLLTGIYSKQELRDGVHEAISAAAAR